MTGQGEGDTAKMLKTYCNTKIVSEYDQEIQQSQTADKPVASWGRATQQSSDTKKTNKAKQPAKVTHNET